MPFLSHRRDVAGQLLVCILACLLALLFLTQTPPTEARAAGFSYATQAKLLNQLGLYRGVSVDEFVPDLGAALNRQTGAVMVLRLFGLEAAAEAIDDPHLILARFGDAAPIAPWAAKAIAYGVENGLIVGLPDGSFGPQVSLNGKAYCTLILRQLGYTPNYDNSAAELAGCGGLTVREAVEFTSKYLTRDDLVGISYGALAARYADGPQVIDRLLELGVLTPEQVERSYVAP